MLPKFNITDEMTSSATSMDISESFRPEDLSKTDFFDFVSAPPPEQESNQATQNSNNVNNSSNDQQPLQGFDQFWGAEKETQQRLESAIFDDLNRYCWNQQNANISISTATTNSSNNSATQVINGDGQQIYTITVLNSSSGDQWLRKDITTTSDQPNGLDINLDTILSNYPYVKTECFSYEDSGFGTAESTKAEDISFQHPPTPQQLLQPQSTGVTTSTSVLLENNLSASSDLISYTDVSNNNNNEWNMDRNEIAKDWETCEANESPESLLRSALQGKGYGKTVHLQNGITVIPAQNSVKDEELRRVLFNNDQETLTFADSTLSSSLFDDSQNPQSTLSQHGLAPGVAVDDMFLTLDSAFTDDFEKMKRIANEVQQFCTVDSQGNSYGDVITIDNAINTNQLLTSNDITNNNNLIINNNNNSNNNHNSTGKINKSRSNGIKTTKKYKKSISNSNILNNNNDTSTINNNLNNTKNINKNVMNALTTSSNNNNASSVSAVTTNATSMSPGTVCNGIRKERSLHYCSICSKGFKDKYSVNVHIRTHTGEKPFACNLCGKSFRQKAHLAKHYQTHLQKNTNGSVKSKHHQKNHSIPASTPAQPIAQTTNINVINVVAGR